MVSFPSIYSLNLSPVVSWTNLIVALAYLDSGKVKVGGIVNKTFTIDQWDECLESMRNKSAIKAAIVFQ